MRIIFWDQMSTSSEKAFRCCDQAEHSLNICAGGKVASEACHMMDGFRQRHHINEA